MNKTWINIILSVTIFINSPLLAMDQKNQKYSRGQALKQSRYQEKMAREESKTFQFCPTMNIKDPRTQIFLGLMIVSGAIGTYNYLQSGKTAFGKDYNYNPSYSKAELISMSEKTKLNIYNKLDKSSESAYFCAPDILNEIKQKGVAKDYQEKISVCNSIVDSWDQLKPKHFLPRFFSTAPSSENFIINQRQYAVASGIDAKHVLLTANLMKCVGLALYNPETNRCGLAHIDGENIISLDAYLMEKIKYEDNLDDFHRFLSDVARETPLKKVRATIMSGYSVHINYVKSYLEFFGIKEVYVIHDPEWGKNGNGYLRYEIKEGKKTLLPDLPKGSIAIDCQSGQISKIKNAREIGKIMGMPPIADSKRHPLKKVDTSEVLVKSH